MLPKFHCYRNELSPAIYGVSLMFKIVITFDFQVLYTSFVCLSIFLFFILSFLFSLASAVTFLLYFLDNINSVVLSVSFSPFLSLLLSSVVLILPERLFFLILYGCLFRNFVCLIFIILSLIFPDLFLVFPSFVLILSILLFSGFFIKLSFSFSISNVYLLVFLSLAHWFFLAS